MYKKNEKPEVLALARAVILNENKVLLIQRITDDKINEGLWEFPGGKMHKDEDIWECLKHEVKEETDLDINIENNSGYVRSLVIKDKSSYEGYSMIEITFFAKAKNTNVKISNEHQNYKWIDINNIDKDFKNQIELTEATKQVLYDKKFLNILNTIK